jgi:hypothetical protein
MSSQANPDRSLYRYLPLDHETKSIRVMRLHPAGDFETELCCSIIKVQFTSSDSPVYEAVSYAWDGQNPDKDHYITVVTYKNDHNPKKLQIPKNSAVALRNLRKKTADRMLWMDSICIDQSSIEGRNHQVQLMGDIYTRAQRVLIWLGEGESLKAERVFSLLKDLAQLNMHSKTDAECAIPKGDDDVEEDEDAAMEDEDDDMEDDSDDDINIPNVRSKSFDEISVAKNVEDKIRRKEFESKMQDIWNSKSTWLCVILDC